MSFGCSLNSTGFTHNVQKQEDWALWQTFILTRWWSILLSQMLRMQKSTVSTWNQLKMFQSNSSFYFFCFGSDVLVGGQTELNTIFKNTNQNVKAAELLLNSRCVNLSERVLDFKLWHALLVLCCGMKLRRNKSSMSERMNQALSNSL